VTSGPKVVAIGGGHGLAATLRAARTYAGSLTAVVSVADDGGSSGRLRELTGLPAMGDIRRCLSAMADPAIPLSGVFEHRYSGSGSLAPHGIEEHALGNLMIAAMAGKERSFTAAIRYFRDLLGVSADVLPATEVAVVLVADTDDGPVRGQVAVKACSGIKRVALDPADPPAQPDAVTAIAQADQLVIGPGSLFTSVLAALAVPGIRDAVAASSASTVYVANLADEPETAGYDVAGCVSALNEHGIRPQTVLSDPRALATAGGRAHDPDRLGAALAALTVQ
jgi:uncharacterized cofD-like protein